VIGHKDSRLAGTSWSNFYEVESGKAKLTPIGRDAFKYFYSTVKSYLSFVLRKGSFKKGGFFTDSYVRPEYTYSALRSRPGDVQSLSLERQEALISKDRDRNAVGIWVGSQIGWPIFGIADVKKKLYAEVYDRVRKIFPQGAVKYTPEEMGVDFYKKIRDGKDYLYYDTANAEKLEGYLVPMTTRSCFSEQGIDPKLGAAKDSGGFNTRLVMYLAQSLLHQAAIDLSLMERDPERIGAADNFGTKKWFAKKQIEEVFSPAYRMLGHDHQGLVGLRIARDGAKTNYTIGPKYNGCSAVNKRIPSSALIPALLGLGYFQEVSYWDWFLAVPWELQDFEAGGTHNAFSDVVQEKSIYGLGDAGKMLWKAQTEIQDIIDRSSLLVDSFKSGIYDYKYDITGM
jgi:hypothetical protein